MKKFYFFSTGILFISLFSSAQPEYKDVAPVFFNRCASCHRDGGGAPFSLTGYSETVNNIYGIQYNLTNNIMPPWSPDTSYSRFMHERIITATEKNAILDWINAGAPAGDTTLAPAPPQFSQYKISGTPDLVLKMPVFTSNANSSDSYVCFSIPTNLTQDRILRAYEIVPGNPSIVHHVVVTVDTTNSTSTDASGNCFIPPGDFGIGGYAPGAAPTVFPGEAPLKAGIRIPAGSKIVMQMHYPSGTAGEVDSTQMRLYFYPLNETGVRNVYVETPLQNWTFLIPANSTQTVTAQTNIPSPVSVLAAFPHSHKVCTDIINYAYKNSDTIPLIKMKWDFEWQGYYYYKKPVIVPGGYKLFSSHFYDNTANNPFAPNPNQMVTPGQNTTNEMLFDGFQWLDYQAGDENIDITAILANDSLLNPSFLAEKARTSETSVTVYPNPNTGIFTVKIRQAGELSEYAFSAYNILGEKIRDEIISGRQATIDLSAEKEGLYFYTVNSGRSVYQGKIMILE